MQRGYVSFDIETDGLIEEDHTPGILCACAATIEQTSVGNYRIVERKSWPRDVASDRLTGEETRSIITYLLAQLHAGYRPLTWNGTGFDFRVLCERMSDSVPYQRHCEQLALSGIDPMLTFFMQKGFPVSLASVALVTCGPSFGKIGRGADAVALWDSGNHEARRGVVAYCERDVDVLATVWSGIEAAGNIRWNTKRTNRIATWVPSYPATVSSLVRDVIRMPPPDNSWMRTGDDRPTLAGFAGWLLSP